MARPNLTDLVIVEVNPAFNNGQDKAPGIVTSVVNAEKDADVRVNVTAFLDTGATKKVSNVKVFKERPVGDKEDAAAAEGGYKSAWVK